MTHRFQYKPRDLMESTCSVKVHVGVKIHVKRVKIHVKGVKWTWRCEFPGKGVKWTWRCEFPGKGVKFLESVKFLGIELESDLGGWPWTWPLFHRYIKAQTIYYLSVTLNSLLLQLFMLSSFYDPFEMENSSEKIKYQETKRVCGLVCVLLKKHCVFIQGKGWKVQVE